MSIPIKPSVSIIMPAFNAQAFIGEAIDSVIAQTYQDWELLIVDDGSTDATAQRVAAYTDPRIRFLRNDRNRGVVASRNRAIDESIGKYVAFLDSDDVWLPLKLDAQVQVLDSGVSVSYGDYVRMTQDGRALGKVSAPAVLSYEDMLKSNFIGLLTAMYRKEIFPNLRFEACGHEDYVFWLRAVKIAGTIRATLPGTPLAHYRLVGNSLSARKGRSMTWQWHIYRKILGLSLPRSVYYFTHYIFNAVRKRCAF